MTNLLSRRTGNWVVGLLTVALICASAGAAVRTYTVDGNTTQLWHFDETSGNAINSVTGGWDLSMSGRTGGTVPTQGVTSAAGFGSAITVDGFDGARAINTDPNDPYERASDFASDEGAFTMEAIVQVSGLDSNRPIITLGSGGSTGTRSFWFLIQNDYLVLYDVFTDAGNEVDKVLIPTTGDDAFSPDNWYHVAVTYNGLEGVTDNLKFYWTLVDDSRTSANLIGTGTKAVDLDSSQDAFFVVGNTARGALNMPLNGSIDEVRMSDVARGAGDMLFIPEPMTVMLLLAGGGLALARRKR